MATNPDLVNALAAIAGALSGSQPQPQRPAQLGSAPTSAPEGIDCDENRQERVFVCANVF